MKLLAILLLGSCVLSQPFQTTGLDFEISLALEDRPNDPNSCDLTIAIDN